MKAFVAVLAGATVVAAIGAITALGGAPAQANQNAVVRVKLGEFGITSQPRAVSAGKVTFSALNIGEVEHELVIIRSSKSALPVKKFKAVEPEAGVIGEIEDVEPGKRGKLTATLSAGKYLLICNIVGHYQLGMRTMLTVR